LKLIRTGPSSLCDWNIAANALLAQTLGVTTPTLRASELPVVSGDKQARIISMCRQLGATRYLCGPGSRSYVSDADFMNSGFEVVWLDYNYGCGVQTTQGRRVFASAFDLILTRGADGARSIMANCIPANCIPANCIPGIDDCGRHCRST